MLIKENPRGQTYSEESRLPTRKEIENYEHTFVQRMDTDELTEFDFVAVAQIAWPNLLHAAAVALDLTERVKVLEEALKECWDLFGKIDGDLYECDRGMSLCREILVPTETEKKPL